MLSKIFSFSHRKGPKKITDGETDTESFLAVQRPFPKLESSEIRVLVFKDCDRKGKTLLFDSRAIVNSDTDPKDGGTGCKTCHEPNKKLAPAKAVQMQYGKSPRLSPRRPSVRPSSDSKMLGEMIFGSVAMTYKGSTVKVHTLRSPPQLLMTRVFALKPRILVPNCCESGDYLNSGSQVDSLLDHSSRLESDNISLSSQSNSPKEDESLLGPMSRPVAVPGPMSRPVAVPGPMSRPVAVPGPMSRPVAVPGSSPGQNAIDYDDDSGLTASYESIGGGIYSPYTPSSSPCGSYQRRLMRSQMTSMDLSFCKKREESAEELSPVLRRRPKIGIGIIFSLNNNEEKGNALQGFFFSHFPLLESHCHRLRLAVANACFSKQSFVSLLLEAVESFKQNIINLVRAPRLKEPVWLNMMTYSDRRSVLCEKFMVHLVDVLVHYNTRETNFFMSGLLTAVLTHHLSWVATVMPAGTAPNRAYLDKHSSQTLDLLAQSHPYNPLWAQLGDLYGAVGFPLKLTRTIVTGQDVNLVSQIISVLSYFIRCTEVFEHHQKKEEMSNCERCGSESSSCTCTGKLNTDTLCQCDSKEQISDESGVVCGDECSDEIPLICSRCGFVFKTECSRTSHNSDCIGKDSCKEIFDQLTKSERNSCFRCGKERLDLIDDDVNKLNGLTHQCIYASNNALAKELKQFMPIKTATFKCYCCQETKLVKPEQRKSSFKCYLGEDADTEDEDIVVTPHTDSSTDDTKTDLVRQLSHQSTSSNAVGEKESASTAVIKDVDGDSCISMDMDSISVAEETVASYGRSGSADSGIHNSPVPSPSTKCTSNIRSFSSVCEELDEELGAEEICLPRVSDFKCYPEINSVKQGVSWRNSNNFGRSLFAGVSESYLPDFVLQGTATKNFMADLSSDLRLTLQNSVLDEPVSEAVCIVADTDTWNCEVLSVKKNRRQSSTSGPSESVHRQLVEVSNVIVSMLMSVQGLWNIGMSAEFCLMHLEDRLKEIYLKSKVISECLKERRRHITKDNLAHMLGIDDNDISLLLAVAGTHAPQGVSFVKIT